MMFPDNVNITDTYPAYPSITNSSSGGLVTVLLDPAFWTVNSTVSDIWVEFEGQFPPHLIITKTITPRIAPGGTATVTLNLTNGDPAQTVYNIDLDDSHSWDTYLLLGSVSVSGATSASYTSIAPQETVLHTYTVSISTEGSYLSGRANVTFEDAASGGESFEKSSLRVFMEKIWTSNI